MDAKSFRELFHFGQLAEATDIENALKVEYGDNAVLIVWQPGTGTRYCVLLSHLPQPIGKELGCSDEALLVTLIHHNRSYPVRIHRDNIGDVFHESYVSEKFDLRMESDTCQAVAAIVNSGVNCLNSSYGAECIKRVMQYAR